MVSYSAPCNKMENSKCFPISRYLLFAPNLLCTRWIIFLVAVACGSCSRKTLVLEEFTGQFGPKEEQAFQRDHLKIGIGRKNIEQLAEHQKEPESLPVMRFIRLEQSIPG